MNSSPLVSIVIITMNHEKFIEQACQSALAQTYPNIEIILLDNLSADGTYSKAKDALANAKIPVKVFQNTEQYGIAKNLNILVSHVSGTYTCILSGDDWLSENSISEKVKYLQESNVDFAISDGYKYLQEEGRLVDAYSDKMKKKIIKSMPDFFKNNITNNEPHNVGVIVKTNLLKNHPFDENIHAEDWDMNLRLTSLGYKIGFVDQKLFNYRILKRSLSSNWVLMESSYKKVTDKYLDIIKADQSLYKKYQINLLKYKYEKILAEIVNDQDKQRIIKNWKKDKYKIKYSQPLLFFKLLLLK